MKRVLQLFIMILSLGIFLMPAQNAFAKSEMDCCKKETVSSCHKDHKSGKDSETKKSCNETCCTNCNACSQCCIPALKPEVFKENQTEFPVQNKNQFSYKQIAFFSDFKEIWQPPKIA